MSLVYWNDLLPRNSRARTISLISTLPSSVIHIMLPLLPWWTGKAQVFFVLYSTQYPLPHVSADAPHGLLWIGHLFLNAQSSTPVTDTPLTCWDRMKAHNSTRGNCICLLTCLLCSLPENRILINIGMNKSQYQKIGLRRWFFSSSNLMFLWVIT